MDCNKDEALRAKQLAEKKMAINDFEGAQKIASKAQNLYPELENINQLMSICDVHCSAQKRILGPEKDWYGILQVARFADEVTVKKQYRRLALHLHPDKNRFPGAEAAFKLICEANAVLSDPAKKSVYDTKIKVTARSAVVNPPPHMNRSTQFNKQHAPQNNVSNGFAGMEQHRLKVFWTSCPFCSSRYQYDRKHVNTSLCCPNCSKNFMGYEISLQGVPMGSNWAPPSASNMPSNPSASFQGKSVPDRAKFTSQWTAGTRPVQPGPAVRTESVFPGGIHVKSAVKVNGDMNGKAKDRYHVNSARVRKDGGTSNGDTMKRETAENKTKKKGRKMVVESSESFETSSDSDLEDVTMEQKDPAANMNSGPSNVHFPRRSSRKRQHVSYNEGGGDDDLPSPLKKSQASELSEGNENEENDDFSGEASKREKGTVRTEESSGDKDANHDKKVKARGAGGKLDAGVDTVEIESDSDLDSSSPDDSDEGISQDSNEGLLQCAEPEFSDFDQNREESCFAANQFWALYDDVDNMPRFYAKVRKVQTYPFELSITWIEPQPLDDDAHSDWVDGALPVGCGSFKLGKTDKTSLRLTFSHQLHFKKGKTRGSLIIHPKRGEVWALFKDWDISWGSEPENHKEFKYEVVEVLADFDEVAGIRVCYLDKVPGFVSIFQRSSQIKTPSFLIGLNELYKFSHLIPSFKMTGAEKEGVPVGSLELDPACLPLNHDDLYYPSKAKVETVNISTGGNFASPKSAAKMGKFVKSDTSSAPKVVVEIDDSDEEILSSRRSRRGQKS